MGGAIFFVVYFCVVQHILIFVAVKGKKLELS